MLWTFVLKRKTVQLKKDVSVQQPNASEYTQTIIGWKLTKFTVLQQKNINVLYSLHYGTEGLQIASAPWSFEYV